MFRMKQVNVWMRPLQLHMATLLSYLGTSTAVPSAIAAHVLRNLTCMHSANLSVQGANPMQTAQVQVRSIAGLPFTAGLPACALTCCLVPIPVTFLGARG